MDSATEADATQPQAGDKTVVPVIAEQLEVARRTVEAGRLRLRKSVQERQEVVDLPVTRHEVVVDRVPINRIVTEPPQQRHEGDTLIIPVLEEVLVVEKRLMLKEEIRITRRESETHEPKSVTLRRENVEIDRVPANPPAQGI